MMIFVFVISLVAPVYGQENTTAGQTNINKEQATAIAQKALKDYFNMFVEDKKYTSRIENRRDWLNPDRYVWVMNWHHNDPLAYSYANVTVDAATGDILEMSSDKGTYKEQRAKVTTITREEAQKKAEAFIGKIIPNLLAQTQLMEEDDAHYRRVRGGAYPLFYHFRYIRLYDGIKYDANSINVGVDGATGEIRSFHYRWDDIRGLPGKEGIKSMEEAKRIFKDKINMELIYQPIWDEMDDFNTPKDIKLVYKAAQHFGNMMDAKTGSILDWNGKVKDPSMKTKDVTEQERLEILKQAKPIQKNKKEITKERAETLALAILKEVLGENVKINGANYMEGENNWDSAGRKAWNIEFSVENPGKKDRQTAGMPIINGRIMMDALTEEVLAYSNGYDYLGYDHLDFESAMTWEEAYDKAIEVIARYHPDKIDDIKTAQAHTAYTQRMDGKEIPPMEYYFYFPRVVNDVLYEEDHINVSFNNRTGKLQHFNFRWNDDVDFPSKQQVISENEAKNILLKHNEVELAYYQWRDNNTSKHSQAKLIYRLAPKNPQINPYMLIDALSGRPIDDSGKNLLKEENNDFDRVIQNHWIGKNAKILAQQGILDTHGFQPDQPITKLDVIKMLVKAKGMGSYYPIKEDGDQLKFSDIQGEEEDYPYVYMAVRYGIIDNEEGELNPRDNITREALTMMLVKLLKYDALAKSKDIFKLSFDDQDQMGQEAVGAVAICQGLDILRSKTGSFRPKDLATMAEAADMVYRALKYIER